MKITKLQLKQIIKEQVGVLKENVNPIFNAQTRRKENNIVAALYFSWTKQQNNNASFWNSVVSILQQQDCELLNYVVTDSVCEFEFQPTTLYGQDDLQDAVLRVEDALQELSSQVTNYDVYVVGN